MNRITLSARGIRSIIYRDNSEFTFILPNHEEVKCKTVLADFISPIIANHHQNDATFEEFELGIDKNTITGITKNHLEKLIELASGESIELSKTDIVIMKIISVLLGNEELLNLLEDFRHNNFIGDKNNKKSPNNLKLNGIIIEPNEFTVSNILQVLNFYSSRSINSQRAIDFAAKNFEKIDKEQLKKISHHTLESILTSDKLVLENEDSLLNFILSLRNSESKNETQIEQINESIAELLESVNFDYLSEDAFQRFLKEFDVSYMTASLFRQIGHAFKSSQPEKLFEMKNGSLGRFHGIIFYLTNKFGGNVNEKGVISITGESVRNDPGLIPQVAADLFDLQSCFHSRNELGSTLTYDFKDFRVTPTCYSIRTNPWGGKGHYHLMNWDIEGSNDGENWFLLDRRVDERSLDMMNNENTFQCNKILMNKNDANNVGKNEDKIVMSFRYLRIRNTGANSGVTQTLKNVMNVGALEFFGKLKYLYKNRYM